MVDAPVSEMWSTNTTFQNLTSPNIKIVCGCVVMLETKADWWVPPQVCCGKTCNPLSMSWLVCIPCQQLDVFMPFRSDIMCMPSNES